MQKFKNSNTKSFIHTWDLVYYKAKVSSKLLFPFEKKKRKVNSLIHQIISFLIGKKWLQNVTKMFTNAAYLNVNNNKKNDKLAKEWQKAREKRREENLKKKYIELIMTSIHRNDELTEKCHNCQRQPINFKRRKIERRQTHTNTDEQKQQNATLHKWIERMRRGERKKSQANEVKLRRLHYEYFTVHTHTYTHTHMHTYLLWNIQLWRKIQVSTWTTTVCNVFDWNSSNHNGYTMLIRMSKTTR